MTSPKKAAPKAKFPLSVIPKAKKAPKPKTKSRAELEAIVASKVLWVNIDKLTGEVKDAWLTRSKARLFEPPEIVTVRAELVVRGRKA